MGIVEKENLVLIGTSHISKQSVKNVKDMIAKHDPEAVAIELDAKRFIALQHKEKRGLPNPFKVGFKGLIFGMFGAWAERRLGDYVGVSPGTEMVTAAKIAKKEKRRLYFIDQDIEITLARLSAVLTWKEKGRFAWDILRSLFGFGDRIEVDISKVPDDKVIKQLLEHVHQRYPNIHKVLVEERNEIMANRLKSLMARHEGKIVAVVGAGHVDEILALVSDEPIVSYEFTYQNFK